MRPQTFESFLMDKHAAQYTGLDDGMPDDYDSWLSDMDVMDLIVYAEEWGNLIRGTTLL